MPLYSPWGPALFVSVKQALPYRSMVATIGRKKTLLFQLAIFLYYIEPTKPVLFFIPYHVIFLLQFFFLFLFGVLSDLSCSVWAFNIDIVRVCVSSKKLAKRDGVVYAFIFILFELREVRDCRCLVPPRHSISIFYTNPFCVPAFLFFPQVIPGRPQFYSAGEKSFTVISRL